MNDIRIALAHAEACRASLHKALAILQALPPGFDKEPDGGPDDDNVKPTDFAGDNVPPNPQSE